MWKTFFVFILASCAFIQPCFAQGYTATVHEGDKLIGAYFGVNAFRYAYNNASDGQTITLSEGDYKPLDSPIRKSLKIIGNSAFIVSMGYYTEVDHTNISNITIEADNVHIEGIYSSETVKLGAIRNLLIRRCYFWNLIAEKQHESTIIDQTVIRNHNALAKSRNLIVTNSTIDQMDANTESNMATFQNCVIYTWFPHMHIGIFRNCVLGYNGSGTIYTQQPSKHYNNVFTSLYRFDEDASYSNNALTTPPSLSYNPSCNFDCTTQSFTSMFYTYKNYPADPMDIPLGSDGTPIGPAGGSGFRIYPDVPRGVGYIDTKLGPNNMIHVNVKGLSYNYAATKIVKYRYWWNNRSNNIVEGPVPFIDGEYLMDINIRVPDEVVADRDYALGKCYLDLLLYDDAGACSPMITGTVTDQDAPIVTLEKLPEEVNDGKLMIKWSAIDDWSGVKDYTLEAYIELGVNSYSDKFTTTNQEYLYETLDDKTVAFSISARDSVGNQSAQTAYQYVKFHYIDTEPPLTTFAVNNVGKGTVTASSATGANITWNATDNHDGVKSYNVYYSEETGPFILWMPDTQAGNAVFYGTKGKVYRIIVTATDNNNNAEDISAERAVIVTFN